MIDIAELKFKFLEQGQSQEVDFMGLCHITEDLLWYCDESDTIVFGFEDDSEYRLKITEDTEYEDIQEFFNDIVEEQCISDSINIKLLNIRD
ncbi:MAG: hypothetical protein KZY55_01190 [Paeniclostridium sp.]|uniref:hypothetical protein n=1 Tax=Paraclostridium sordellii TaxID=1505 RepID=UPI0005E487A2|nr:MULTISPECIES: hypothetical protein [Paeniclostridium]MBW4863478.1 hypothetical protein [Paeniclostridium sp.]MBW4872652.1 hypothetical protein [Paeniclostridium sp.]CEN93394.1 Uncharacterised protein [[Clostridium] sordellii] [Paeniclostridium sordellii]CEN94887.1 Uncharacterised protein [[Clostridium] sordellii] [Paeniclostridium sordellii]